MEDIQISSDSFPQFKEIDDVLNCGICHEVLNIPVITACSHTFCSICIRRWLTAKQVCPSCSEEIFESSLRKNTIVGNILDAVQNLKKRLSGPSIKSGSTNCHVKTITSPKIKDVDSNEDFQPKITVKKTPPPTPKQNQSVQPKKTPMPLPKTPSPMVQNSTPGGGRQPPVDDDRSPGIKVPCPVCNVMMPQRLVNGHLDRCLLEPKTRSSESVKTPSPRINHTMKKNIAQSSTSAESSNPPLEPIKKMVYNLLSDKQLKSELRKYGLSIQGGRRALLLRLQRFVILHNAECDSDNPRTLSEIKQSLEKEEKAMSSATAVSSFSQLFKKTDNPEEIEKSHKDYRTQQKDSYQKLIEDVKKRNKLKPPKKEECLIISDNEDDKAPIPVPRPEPTPVPESAHASSSRQVESDCDSDTNIVPSKSLKTPNQRKASESDSDVAPSKSLKTPHRRNAPKNVKRKCIESESEEEEQTDVKRQVKQSKRGEAVTSPVLSRSTPARRQLRSRTLQNKTAQKRDLTPPQTQTITRNSQRAKEPPPEELFKLKRGGWKDDISSDSSDEETPVKRSTGIKQVRQRSPTPDMFESSPASSIPCGQKARNDDSGNEALAALVDIIDNGDTGSTTEYEED